jgi:hypothetical protein
LLLTDVSEPHSVTLHSIELRRTCVLCAQKILGRSYDSIFDNVL